MKSLKRHEGYLLLDNRNSQGVPDEVVRKNDLPDGAGRGLFEAATYQCNHCESMVVLNPLRTRERAYCAGCDHRICDGCAAIKAQTLKCRPMQQVVDEVLNNAERGIYLLGAA